MAGRTLSDMSAREGSDPISAWPEWIYVAGRTLSDRSAMEGSDPICSWSGWPAGHSQTNQPWRVVTLSVVGLGGRQDLVRLVSQGW